MSLRESGCLPQEVPKLWPRVAGPGESRHLCVCSACSRDRNTFSSNLLGPSVKLVWREECHVWLSPGSCS